MLKLRAGLLLTALTLAIPLTFAALLLPASQAVDTCSPETLTLRQIQVPLYELRDEGGEIWIYRRGQPHRPTGVSVASLPGEDRALLEEGIAADSEQTLTSLLEDLCS